MNIKIKNIIILRKKEFYKMPYLIANYKTYKLKIMKNKRNSLMSNIFDKGMIIIANMKETKKPRYYLTPSK